jgi:hypothetical protein
MSDKYTRIAELYARRLSGESQIAAIKPDLMDVAYEQAEALHAEHVKYLQAMGYVFAPENNDDPEVGPLTDNQVTTFALLQDDQQEQWLAATDIARKLYTSAHKTVSKSVNALLYTIAEDVHNSWVSEILQEGYVYGTELNDDEKTCPLLLPFSTLFNDEKLKPFTAHAILIARELFFSMVDEAECAIPAGGIQKKITDLLTSQ